MCLDVFAAAGVLDDEFDPSKPLESSAGVVLGSS